jgi:hypothetical protein
MSSDRIETFGAPPKRARAAPLGRWLKGLVTRAAGAEAKEPAAGGSLAALHRAGLPVAPGFTLPPAFSARILAEGRLPESLEAPLDEALTWLEETAGGRLGDADRPLLLSLHVESEGLDPMELGWLPRLGLTREVWERLTGAQRFMPDVSLTKHDLDSWRDFSVAYAGLDAADFHPTLAGLAPFAGPELLDPPIARAIAVEYHSLFAAKLDPGQVPYSGGPRSQLHLSIAGLVRRCSVLRSDRGGQGAAPDPIVTLRAASIAGAPFLGHGWLRVRADARGAPELHGGYRSLDPCGRPGVRQELAALTETRPELGPRLAQLGAALLSHDAHRGPSSEPRRYAFELSAQGALGLFDVRPGAGPETPEPRGAHALVSRLLHRACDLREAEAESIGSNNPSGTRRPGPSASRPTAPTSSRPARSRSRRSCESQEPCPLTHHRPRS